MTIILSLLNGSRLYGFDHEYSDYDIINVYMKHRNDYYINEPDKIKFRRIESINYQVTYVDLIILCRQLLKCNPNFIIPLMSQPSSVLYSDECGDILLRNIILFLDYEKVNKAFTGMASSSFRLLDKPQNKGKSDYIAKFRDRLLHSLPIGLKADIPSIKFMLDDIFLTQESQVFYETNDL